MRRRLDIRAKLLGGLAVCALLVVALWIAGDHVIRDAAARLEDTLTGHIRPLARMNRLQSQINAIRVMEVEIPRLTDLFAISNQVEMLQAARGSFDRDLGEFLRELQATQAPEAAPLAEHWRRYQSDLHSVVRHANLMELDAVQRISTFESAGRFGAVSRTLKLLAESTEAGASRAFDSAVVEHGRQRRLFVLTSLAGLVVLAAWIGVFGRSVTLRLSRLRDAAIHVAEGDRRTPIAIPGNDEVADLGAAFDTMQQKVRAREQALRASHEELERRVEARTRELNEANAHLRLEIDQRRRIEERLNYQARYDSLTELPNRMLAMDRLNQAIAAAHRAGTQIVLLFLDLDGFKAVNDTFGHHAGDSLLVQASKRLRRAVRSADTVARLGGDEFLVIMTGFESREGVAAVAEEIVAALATPFDVGVSEVVVSASVGLAVYPHDGEDPATLLRNADVAMYDAKECGRSTYRFFDAKAHRGSLRLLTIERELRLALQQGELRLDYQPLVDTATRGIVAAEALLRWQCPQHGVLTPDDFIPAAEHTGLIVEIGEWVLQSACAQARRWRELGWREPRIAVNVSPRQFRGGGLQATVRRCLSEHGLPAATLQLEVTEGVLMRNRTEVQEILEALGALGVGLAMDDFGTGYSSLSYLKRFPFAALKIDREFVRGLATDPGDRALVIAAIRMGKGLGLSVTAEGVETEEQLAILAAHECDIVQGHLLGIPLPAEEFAARWLHRASVHAACASA